MQTSCFLFFTPQLIFCMIPFSLIGSHERWNKNKKSKAVEVKSMNIRILSGTFPILKEFSRSGLIFLNLKLLIEKKYIKSMYLWCLRPWSGMKYTGWFNASSTFNFCLGFLSKQKKKSFKHKEVGKGQFCLEWKCYTHLKVLNSKVCGFWIVLLHTVIEPYCEEYMNSYMAGKINIKNILFSLCLFPPILYV